MRGLGLHYAHDVDPVSVSEGPGYRFLGAGNVLVCVYWATPTVEALRQRLPWIEARLAEGAKVGLLVVVTADAAGALPGREFRVESRRQAERYADAVVLSASVIESDSLMHGLARTFLRTLAMVMPSHIEVRFFDAVDPAAEWVAEAMAPLGGPSAATLSGTVARARP